MDNKLLIHVFTGTGNSLRASEIIRSELSSNNGFTEIDIHKVGNGIPPSIKHYTDHLFITPVYALAPPSIMIRYIKKLPVPDNATAYILSVYGNLNDSEKKTSQGYAGQTQLQLRRMLLRRGYDVKIADALGYSHNLVCIMNTPTDSEIKNINIEGDLKVKDFAKKIKTHQKYIKRCSLTLHILGWLFGMLYRIFGRRAIGKIFVSDGRCNQCGKCVKQCPVNNIKMFINKPVWGFNCEGCQRCINICPQYAVQTSIWRIVLILALLFVPYISIIYPILSCLVVLNNVLIQAAVNIVIWLIGYFTAFFILDKIIVLLERIPFIRKALSFSFTKNYRRYNNSLSKDHK